MASDRRPATGPETIADLPAFLVHFVRNPVQSIREPSRLTWSAALTLQVVASVLAGAISAWVDGSRLDLAISIFIFPLMTVMIGAIFTLFIYYYFAIFTRTYLDIRRLYSLVVIAMVPYFLLHALSGFLPPIDLIGFAVTAILVLVGLVEQFRLAKGPVAWLTLAASLAFFLVWSAVRYAGA